MEKIDNYFLSETMLKMCYEELFGVSEKEKNWDVCILINRKGYWDYKIFFPNGVNLKEGQKIYSDRYIEKCPLHILKKEFEDKRIRIYDDSITHGSNLFYFYLLCKAADAKEIKPYVYACNTSFPSDVAIKLMRREAERIKNERIKAGLLESEEKKIDVFSENDNAIEQEETINSDIKNFIKDLSYKILLGNNDIEKLSTWQTKLFQKYVSPLVMDLPMLNRQKGEDTSQRDIACIVLNKESFKKLCAAKMENWEFIENIVHTDVGFVTASYFRFFKKELWDAFPYLAHDFVVKCKYNEGESEDQVRAVFTPFAIVKSISYEKIWEAFELLYHDTEYAESIGVKQKEGNAIIKKMENDANLCKALFRAVIFRISHYIGLKFQEMVKDEIGIELDFDYGIMEDNFNKAFINVAKEWEAEFNEKSFLSTIGKYEDEKIYFLKEYEYSLRDKQQASQERISNKLRESIIKKKKSASVEDDKNILEKRIYHFEEMENEVDDMFVFQSKEDKRQMITNSCIAGLETNSFSNYLLAKKETHILYRGFRYGENSEVFLHESLWFFYIFLYVYYENYPNNMLIEKYDEFMKELKIYLEKKNYMNVWISEDGFDFLKNYFGKFSQKGELVTEIRRRRYLLDYDKSDKKNQIKEVFLEKAYSMWSC